MEAPRRLYLKGEVDKAIRARLTRIADDTRVPSAYDPGERSRRSPRGRKVLSHPWLDQKGEH